MKVLNRYIASNVISATLLVVLILLGLEMFIDLINELQDIGKGQYGVWQALVYVPLQLPKDVYDLFPIAGLIGSLIGLGRLASSSELIVMRAAGVSKAQITWAVIRATLIMLVIVTAIGEAVAPAAKVFAEKYKIAAQGGKMAMQTRQGVWVRDGDNFIHINEVLPQGQLMGITRYKFEQQELQVAAYAESAFLQNGQWIFKDVSETVFQGKKTLSNHYAEQNWNVAFDPNLLGMSSVDIDQLSLPMLYHYMRYLNANGLSATEYEFAWWTRLLQPLATLVMICLAIPFIFGPLRTVTMGLRILIGVVVGFCFYTLNQFFGPFSMVYQIPPVWAASIPIILFAIIDGFLLWLTR